MTDHDFDPAALIIEFAEMLHTNFDAFMTGQPFTSGQQNWSQIYQGEYRPEGLVDEDADKFQLLMLRKMGVAATFFLFLADRTVTQLNNGTTIPQVIDTIRDQALGQGPTQPVA